MHIARMVCEDFFAQMRRVEMQIYLGSAYRLVSEHLLDGTQIGAPFEKMGGE